MTYDDGSIGAAEAQLRSEHRELNAMLKRAVETASAETLTSLLRGLHTELHQHFANEEYPGGLYERMGVLGPRFRDEVRHLVDDHYKILGSIREMSDRAEAGEAPAELVEELMALVEWMREHEDREHRMAVEARKSQ